MTRADGPLPRLCLPLSWIAARIYGWGVHLRNQRFDGAEGIEVLEAHGRRIPVISVGNITAGGTGKSPFVAWLSNALLRTGKRPVIALRGYRSHTNADGETRSDEAEEYARSAPGAMVVVGANRHARLTEALSKPETRDWIRDAVVILDDGFQHRQLGRAMDIVLVDATRHGLDGDLLPLGWLREPARALGRASFVLVTRADDAQQYAKTREAVARARGAAPDASCRSLWSELAVYEDGVERTEPVSWLAQRRVLVASAIGNPAQFRVAVERAGAVVTAEMREADHRAFDLARLEERLRADPRGEACVMTRKDFVKLSRLPRATVVIPKLSLEFAPSDEQRLLAAIEAVVPLQ